MALSVTIRKRLFAVLRANRLGDGESRKPLISQYTGGRTHSTKEMKDVEALLLINDLTPLSDFWKGDKMRKKIIGMFRTMGVETTQGKADMVKIDDWCIRYGYMHKGINKYKFVELPKLVAQVSNVLNAWYEKARKNEG